MVARGPHRICVAMKEGCIEIAERGIKSRTVVVVVDVVSIPTSGGEMDEEVVVVGWRERGDGKRVGLREGRCVNVLEGCILVSISILDIWIDLRKS